MNERGKEDYPGDRRGRKGGFLTDTEDEDGECYILKDRSKAEETDALYEFVEDDDEIDYLFKIFTELIDDMDVELEK